METDELFAEYIKEPNPEHWRDFPQLMWDLGFEMDYYESAPKYENERLKGETEKDIQDRLLNEMEKWTTQQVGNYIFSRFRHLTHWCDYGYADERGAYFFQRAFPILSRKLAIDWKERNTIPSLELFADLVAEYACTIDQELKDFANSDEGMFYIRNTYLQHLKSCEKDGALIPRFRGEIVKQAVYFLQEMY